MIFLEHFVDILDLIEYADGTNKSIFSVLLFFL
jgi:hypothetical protein